MTIKDITQPGKFFAAVSACKGRVELVTSEGDRLNLKSTLCQYIALTQMFQEQRVDGIQLMLSNPDDLENLTPYILAEESNKLS